ALGFCPLFSSTSTLPLSSILDHYSSFKTEGGAATKCLRVSSSSPTRQVLQTLSERFRPDMKMLTSRYALYEVHRDEERKLEPEEKPLVVQLSWNPGNREGRFVLKKDDDHVEVTSSSSEPQIFWELCLSRLPRSPETDAVIEGNRPGGRKGRRSSDLQKDAFTKGKEGEQEQRSRPGGEQVMTSDLLNNNSLCWSNPHQQKHEGEELRQPGLPLGIYFCDDGESQKSLFFSWVCLEGESLSSFSSSSSCSSSCSSSSEEAFLSAIINDISSSTDHFRLSPAFVLYTAARFALQRHLASSSCRDGVTSIANKMVTMIETVIQASPDLIQSQQFMVGSLAFWLANSSELLIFLKRDKDLGPLTQHSQLDLSHLVHTAYSFLLQSLRNQLCQHLPTFLIDPERHEMVLNTLMSSMSLLRRCRVNPAFSIQLFSQLFHFISAWLFNKLVSSGTSNSGLRSHYWGSAVRQRLTAIEGWAERQGLELVADYHLGHITQATTLLTMNKYSMEDATVISGTCFRLNSLQLRTLLSGYLYAANEPSIPPGLIDAVVGAAETSADNLIRSEGRDIQMEESLALQLPFLLPEEGFSCHSVSGVPQGLRDFLEPISQKGVRLLWTVHLDGDAEPRAAQRQPTVESITLHKPVNSGMGVSIVAAKQSRKTWVSSSDQLLAAGDQLLSVDGHSLHGLNQERAAAVMMQTGPVVTLQVAKSGASYHGLQALMGPPAPENTSSKGGGEAAPENGQPSVVGGRARKEQTMHRSSPNLSGQASTLIETRQSFSQDNLSVDSERPLLDKRQNKWEQNAKSGSCFSSFPIRCSASAHDILSGRSSPSKPQQRGRDSCAGVWRAPFPQQAVPTVQPIRIDIPVTRAVYASPPLTTFQQNSSRTGRTLHADRQGPWSPAGRIFTASAATKASDKPQVSITPTKHVSFQEPPPQQRSSGPGRRGDLRGLSDPWRREAREELRKQQRLLAVERLQQEVEELQKKEQRTAQENDRLRRLSLELQFQRRLQEAQRGEDEEEEILKKVMRRRRGHEAERRKEETRGSCRKPSVSVVGLFFSASGK
uniref:Afadin, adherens junction formation factor a n=1 Tax=Oryzias latipes TaxID=8090 RepID=A0A3P9LRL1_ORYLA